MYPYIGVGSSSTAYTLQYSNDFYHMTAETVLFYLTRTLKRSGDRLSCSFMRLYARIWHDDDNNNNNLRELNSKHL